MYQKVQTRNAFCGDAEIILVAVAENEVAALQFLFHLRHRGEEAGVVRGHEVHLGQQQQTRVEGLAAE